MKNKNKEKREAIRVVTGDWTMTLKRWKAFMKDVSTIPIVAKKNPKRVVNRQKTKGEKTMTTKKIREWEGWMIYFKDKSLSFLFKTKKEASEMKRISGDTREMKLVKVKVRED